MIHEQLKKYFEPASNVPFDLLRVINSERTTFSLAQNASFSTSECALSNPCATVVSSTRDSCFSWVLAFGGHCLCSLVVPVCVLARGCSHDRAGGGGRVCVCVFLYRLLCGNHHYCPWHLLAYFAPLQSRLIVLSSSSRRTFLRPVAARAHAVVHLCSCTT